MITRYRTYLEFLDKELAKMFEAQKSFIKCKEGCAFFFSTHILEVAEKLCNKIAIIKEGKIVISGEMKKIVKDKSLEDIFLELVNE